MFVLFQIGQKYPNSQVELHMVSTQMPNMTISQAGVSVKCAGQINMYANTPSKQTPFLVTLLAVRITCICLINPCPAEPAYFLPLQTV